MKEIILTEIAKEVLIKEYGEDSIKIDGELNELAKLIIKRKNCVQAFNKGNFSAKDTYMEISVKIKKILADINIKLAKW